MQKINSVSTLLEREADRERGKGRDGKNMRSEDSFCAPVFSIPKTLS